MSYGVTRFYDDIKAGWGGSLNTLDKLFMSFWLALVQKAVFPKCTFRKNIKEHNLVIDS